MNVGWLILWATLQVGYVPEAWDGQTITQGVEYVEPGFGGELFRILTVEGSIRTYISPMGFVGGSPNFDVLRDTYTIGVHADPTQWLRVGFLRWCSHQDMPFPGNSAFSRWPGDQGATEFYARLKIGGGTP